MRNVLLGAALAACAPLSWGQQCEGGVYLNPQVIRGEGTSQTDSAVRELGEFLRPTGLPLNPIVNIRDVEDLYRALKKATPPCWVYGNPVVGLASGYKPVAVNMEPIAAAVLLVGDVGGAKEPKPVDLKTLPPADQERILGKLRKTECFGMKSGVTTAMVKAESLCGTVTELLPQQGLGQSYLPTKAAFSWKDTKWVGLITRLQSAQGSTMKGQAGADPKIQNAQLVVVPTKLQSWGYGLYVDDSVPADTSKKAHKQFQSLKPGGHPLLQKALDVGKSFEFVTPEDKVVGDMRKSLQIGPRPKG